ncbi:MAG: hypothetical protein J6X12_07060 [Paludibacteraceae bacterium]|nr:hypothetical protein [Paludibacteraceae bacterium]
MNGIEERLRIKQLTNEPLSVLKKFKSKNSKLNNFLERKAKHHQKEQLAYTYLLFYKNDDNENVLVGYYTLSCSALTATEYIRSKFHHSKQYEEYPAILIGRLAISKDYESKGFGTFILNSIKYSLCEDMRLVAGRFLVLDAVQESIDFYKKNRFEFWTSEDRNEPTRLMFFDLLQMRE